MTGKLIFKMEMFKFLRDKSYLITTAVLGVVNIIITLVCMSALSNFSNSYGYDYGYVQSMVSMIIIPLMLILVGNWIFMFIYPFHILSVDYKNNVMAMLIASGVNRTKLFFSKIGAVLLCTILVSFSISIVPFIIILAKASQEIGIQNMFDEIMRLFSFAGISTFQLLGIGLLSYLNMIVLVATACILLKGNNLTFIVYIGFSLAFSIVNGLLMKIPDVFYFSYNGIIFFQILLYIASICIFGFISLNTLKRQNL